ncbi:MAG: HYR domain-containing protein [Saprospiraceae bacterium]|nr:HYR domain-containing protein [Saprospiraceae bacterium]
MGSNAVVLTVTDVNGNVSTCNSTVTVEDNVAPIAVCQDITVQLDGSGLASITAIQIDNGSTDNCGIASLAIDISSFDCSDVGSNAVVLTVTDVNGNVSTCNSTVTVEDNVAPIAVCQDITVQLDGSGLASITAIQIDNGSTDNCGIASMAIDISSFDCSDVGSNAVVLTVTDVNGNVSTCNSTVTVEDNVAPIAVCQDITVQLDGSGLASITAIQIDNGSTDNCGIASLAIDISSFDCSDVGSNAVVLTVTDVNGNVSTCNSTVTVEDNVAPIAVCQDITVQLDGSGLASITAIQIDNGSTDNCGIASLAIDISSFDCSDVGSNAVVLTITDVNGNVSTCNSTVTVEDNVAPIAVCQDITVQLDGSGLASITAIQIDNGSTDNCGIASLAIDISSFDCSDVGSNAVVLTVTDVNGNVSTCNSTVTVEDNVAPIAVCQDITVQLDGSGLASITAIQIDNGSTDNCGIASLSIDISSFDCSDVGSNAVVLTVTDVNGNVSTCNSTVTVEDDVAPLGSFPSPIIGIESCQPLQQEVEAAFDESYAVSTYTDNCSSELSATLTGTEILGSNCSWQVNYTYTVFDENGNGLINQIYTVQGSDQTTPILTPPSEPVLFDVGAFANCTATLPDFTSLVSVDDCSQVTLTQLAPNQPGTIVIGYGNDITIEVMAEDECGHTAMTSFTVQLVDETAPQTICQIEAVNLALDASGDATLTPAMIDAGSFDNCSAIQLSLDQTSFSCSDVGIQTVTLTAIDASGNSSACTAQVNVMDNTAPALTCLGDITVPKGATCSAMMPNVTSNVTINEACGVASVTQSVAVGTIIGAMTTSVSQTLTVVDINGNSSTCSFNVLFVDQTAPVINGCPANISLDTDPGMCTTTATWIEPTATDNCTQLGPVVWTKSHLPGSQFSAGVTTVTYTATDASGNSSTCIFTVTVIDDESPVMPVLADITVDCDDALVAPTTTDNCAGTVTGTTTDVLSFVEGGTTTIEWTFDDGNGNSTTAM